MLLKLMELAGFVYYYTWFVWPFAFVFALGNGIKEVIETKKVYNKGFIGAGVALLFILAGIALPDLRS